MRVVFMGTPKFVIPVLDSLAQATEVELIGVYTPPDRPRGRGRSPEMPPVKEHALTLGLPVFLIFMIWLPLRGLSALVRRGRELPAPRESHFRNPRPL